MIEQIEQTDPVAEEQEVKELAQSLEDMFEFVDQLELLTESFLTVFQNLKPSLSTLTELSRKSSIRQRLQVYLEGVPIQQLRNSEDREAVTGNLVKLNVPDTDPYHDLTFIVIETFTDTEGVKRVHLHSYNPIENCVLRDEITSQPLVDITAPDTQCMIVAEE